MPTKANIDHSMSILIIVSIKIVDYLGSQTHFLRAVVFKVVEQNEIYNSCVSVSKQELPLDKKIFSL